VHVPIKSKNTILSSSSDISVSTPEKINVKNTPFLIIVESPSKCKKIEKYLGFQYKCIASNGHIRRMTEIKRKKSGVLYEPIFGVLPEKKAHVEKMRHIIAVFEQENIFIATDDDREGEAIGWHICQTFGLEIERVKRIVFNEITEFAIKAAVKSPMKIRMPIVLAQQTRQILDQMVGFEISPLLTRKMASTEALSAGRCQTPALRFVYDKFFSGSNDCKNSEISLEKKYHVSGFFFSSSTAALGPGYGTGPVAVAVSLPLEATLSRTDFSETEMKCFLEASLDFKHEMKLGEGKEKRTKAPIPFHTSALLQTANSLLHLSPKKTMEYCQILYQHGFITYMRTESTKYADVFLQQIEKYVQEKKWLGDWEPLRNHAGMSAHEAIRITNIHQTVVDMSSILDSKIDQRRIAALYDLIWKRSLESCMSDYIYKEIEVRFSAPTIDTKESEYLYSLEIPLFAGWKRYSFINKKEESEKGMDFEMVMDKDFIRDKDKDKEFQEKQLQMNAIYTFLRYAVSPVKCIKIQAKQVWYKESNRYYTESTLIHTLEKHGIGRPSTYAFMVDTIQERKYVKIMDIEGETKTCMNYVLDFATKKIEMISEEKVFGQEKNKLVLQPLGKEVLENLIPTFDTFFSYDYTREMETKLDMISSSSLSDKTSIQWYDICKEVDLELKKKSKEWKTELQQIYKIDNDYELIFSCKHGVLIRNKVSSEYQYQKVRKMEIDIEKLKRKEYTLEDLLEIPREVLGIYQEKEIRLKNGKFGLYFIWGEEKPRKIPSSLSLKKDPWEIKLEDIISCISGEVDVDMDISRKTKSPSLNKTDLRILSDTLSIKKGKYGAYIYHKPALDSISKVKSPTPSSSPFYNLKLFPGDYMSCDKKELLDWIHDTYGIV